MTEHQYAGFWIRVVASIIDTILLLMVIIPLLMAFSGGADWASPEAGLSLAGLFLNYVLPAVVIILFWIYRSATPGKMILGLKIIDEKTGGKPSTGQFIGRYLCYFVSTIPLMLGLIWVAFSKRKQGWHDRLAGTLVVRG